MQSKPRYGLADYFAEIKDPRMERRKRHKLIDIIAVAICGVVCGAETWVDIENYGKAKFSWLKEFLELANGIPSHDTFNRVFTRIDPEKFQECFINWVSGLRQKLDTEIVAIDGKQLRGSLDRNKKQKPITMVSAFAIENRLILGQKKTSSKSNEITALPELIEVLDLAECVVTIDAIGCQEKIVKKIVDKSADYVIAVKENQGSLFEEVQQLFKQAIARKEELKTSSCTVTEVNRGREEIRNYLVISDADKLISSANKWTNIKSIGLVESVRIVRDKTSVKIRYFISSIDDNIELFSRSIRSHWGIENSLHWVLDVAMREDLSRIRKDNAPANFAVLRHIAVNILRQNKSKKIGIRAKQFVASMDETYLDEVLAAIF
jgi:predicted transposase YbfD/YdcC